MSSPVPIKVRVAGTAVVTLLLGLAAGLLYGGGGAELLEVEVPGAQALRLVCGDKDVRVSTPRVAVFTRAPCAVHAIADDGSVRVGEVRASSGRFRCEGAETLRCALTGVSASSP